METMDDDSSRNLSPFFVDCLLFPDRGGVGCEDDQLRAIFGSRRPVGEARWHEAVYSQESQPSGAVGLTPTAVESAEIRTTGP